MERLEAELKGPKLFVKRDDLTDLAMGGNKVRQLDYILVEAVKQRADVLVTTCGVQSNWSRQMVGAAIKLGMETVLVLRSLQFKKKPDVYDGNILLDYIMGAKIRVIKMGIGEDPAPFLEEEAGKLRKKGRRPHVLGLDALMSPRGALGYVEAMRELSVQLKAANVKLDAIVVPGGGPTHAGVLVGARSLGMSTRVIGVPVAPSVKKGEKVESALRIAKATARLIHSDMALSSGDVIIEDGYAGERYGVPTPESLEAIRLVARREAIILDPVYTSKVMSGMIGMIRSGAFKKDDNVCFLHTGGVPALFAYKGYFQPPNLRRPITIL
jgi:D-cysteine desulfhydrase family pyridoxal phosphate-dependent enzyme